MHPADLPGPLVFVVDLDRPDLADGDRHHLSRVLRLRPGDPMTIADGAGRWRPARFGEAVDPSGPIVEQPPPSYPVAVGFALVKGDKPELVVQKLTELGVDRIIPFRAARSVVRWDEARAAKAVERLRSVCRAAAMQCHRPRLPVVEGVAELNELARRPGAALADRTGGALGDGHRIVLVGPEGGWEPDELTLAPAVLLGTEVLRAETAAMTAGAILAALRAGLVRPA